MPSRDITTKGSDRTVARVAAKKPKSDGVKFAIVAAVILVFYVGVCLLALPYTTAEAKANWNDFTFEIYLIFIAVPTVTLVFSILSTLVFAEFAYALLVGLLNALMCMGALYFSFNIRGTISQPSDNTYIIYSVFILCAGLVISGLTLLIAKLIKISGLHIKKGGVSR